ncbi:hypothetical protein HAZT_HAZT011562, partial [Hyalella azteca]
MANNKEVKHNLKLDNSDVMMTIAIEGLQHPRAVAFLLLWYFFSAGTLFLNKYILTYLSFNPYLMCEFKLGTILFGLVALYYVAVSFAETVKSSAPLVTVFLTWLLR